MSKVKLALVVFIASIQSGAFAALPAQQAQPAGVTQGDYIGLATYYGGLIAVFFGVVLGAAGLMVVAKNCITTYGEIGDGRKTWTDLGMQFGFGVVLIMVVLYLLNVASGIIS